MTQGTHSPAPASVPADAEPVAPAQKGIRWGRLLVWGTILGLLGLLGWQLINSGMSQPTEGRAPDFTLTTFDGEEIRLAELRGRVVVINFWASWCAPCIEEAPELEATWQTYKDQGVLFVGIDYLDSESKGRAFLETHGITYPNGPDLGQKISGAYHIRGVPETFVIDAEGNITYFAALPITRDVLSLEIEKAMRAGS